MTDSAQFPGTGITAVLRRIHRRESTWIDCAFVSLFSGALLAAAACLAAWCYALAHPLVTNTGREYIRVSDASLAMSFAVCGVAWGGVLYWTWRGHAHDASFVPPLIGTVVLASVAAGGCALIDELIPSEEEYLMTALCCLSGAGVLWLWLGFVTRYRAGRALVNEHDEINVHCPKCGYSLVGLRDLRCPECGATFEIDGLIRAQGYRLHRHGATNGNAPTEKVASQSRKPQTAGTR